MTDIIPSTCQYRYVPTFHVLLLTTRLVGKVVEWWWVASLLTRIFILSDVIHWNFDCFIVSHPIVPKFAIAIIAHAIPFVNPDRVANEYHSLRTDPL